MQVLKHEASYYQTPAFKWRQRIGFGISDYACNLAYLVANTYLMFYYTNCAGINAAAIGVMMVVTRFVDAFTDYMVGVFIDRTDTKHGRYRPWMLAGAPVLAVGMALVFAVPVNWGDGAKLAWAFISYFIMSFGYTMVNIPMAPIVSALSAEPAERTKIATTRTVFSNLGSMTASLFTLPLIWMFAGASDANSFNAVDNAAKAVGYRNTNIILAVMVIVILVICFFMTVEINPPSKVVQQSSFIDDLKHIFQSKYYIILLASTLLLFMGYFCMYGAMQYYYTYVLADPGAQPLGSTLLTVCAIPTMILAAALNGKGFSKRNLMIFGTAVDLVAYLILFLVANPTVATIALGLIGLGMGFRQSMYFSIMPDIFDYTEWQFGKNMGGTQNAVNGFMNKVSSAASGALTSALLVWCAYESHITELDALAAAGTSIAETFPQVNTAFKIAFSGVSVIACVIGILLMLPYDLDKKYPQIRADLDERQKQTAE